MEAALNGPEFRVERAAAQDARAIAEIHVESWRAAYRGLVPQGYLDALSVPEKTEFWSAVIAQGEASLLVARTPLGGIAGWLCAGASRDADAPPGTAEVQALYVRPSHWSLGAGQVLWHACLAQLVVQGAWQRVTLWVLAGNERGLAFYRQAGFVADEAAGSPSFELGGATLHEQRLVFTLPSAAPSATGA